MIADVRASVVLVAVASAALVAAAPPAAPEMPGPSRHSTDAARDDAACAGCHVDIAREWSASLHRQAYDDPSFARALAREPLDFCRDCHAPEGGGAHHEGVGCVTCHAGAAAPLAVAAEHASPASPHAVTRDARFATDAACARCHEFAFPDAARRTRAENMQLTVSEHRASQTGVGTCSGCHMPLVGPPSRRHHAHDFAASRDEALLRSAADIGVTRPSPGVLRLTFTPRDIGHAFPTGDLFRRLEVSATATVAGRDLVARRFLERHFGEVQELPGVNVKSALLDDRPFSPFSAAASGPATVDLDVGSAAASAPIRWEVRYQRVAHPVGVRANDLAAAVDGDVLVASGVSSAAP